jgi:hypothetical protein
MARPTIFRAVFINAYRRGYFKMRFKPMVLGMVVMAMIFSLGGRPPVSAQSGLPEAGPTPSVFIPEKAFEFQPVIEGEKVVHDFSIINKGTLPLLITNVRTG